MLPALLGTPADLAEGEGVRSQRLNVAFSPLLARLVYQRRYERLQGVHLEYLLRDRVLGVPEYLLAQLQIQIYTLIHLKINGPNG